MERGVMRNKNLTINNYNQLQYGKITATDIDGFIEEFKDLGLGFNDYVIRNNKTLKDICTNDKTFDIDFHAYLKAFDPETKYQ